MEESRKQFEINLRNEIQIKDQMNLEMMEKYENLELQFNLFKKVS